MNNRIDFECLTADIIRWNGVAVFGIMAAYALSERNFLGALLFLLAGLIIAPLGFVQKFRNKLKLNKSLSIVLAVVLLFGGALAMPTSKTPTNNTGTQITENGFSGDTYCKTCGIKIASGEATPKTEDSTQQENNSQTVYITKTGRRYHSTKRCSGLNNANEIYDSTLSEAQGLGLTPCSKCY